ncbi:MAG TPA: radical SAM protein [Clostridia bacterium]|nr:radical SAM protein [Clostridia bacterium]
MKILLINPPKSPKNLVVEYAPQQVKEIMKRMDISGPPLSLCSIAGNLRDFDVDIFDLKAEYDLGLTLSLDEAVSKKIVEFNPDIVGVTIYTSEYNAGCRIFKLAKEINPKILTIAGGIHASLSPADFYQPTIDITIFGHGKKIFRDVVLAQMNHGDFSDIPNICVQKDGQFFTTKKENLFLSPDKLLSNVYANRELVKKYESVYKVGNMDFTLTYMETSYGCPSRCSFCSIWPMNQGHYYTRNIEDIVGELNEMKDYKLVRFGDANTTGDLEFSHKLFDRLIEEGYDKGFIADIRNDTAANHPDLIAKAAKAGLKAVIVGIESINEQELDFYNKESSKDAILRSIEVLKKNDIMIRGLFIAQPDYVEKDFENLAAFAKENEISISSVTIMTPFPGTPLYHQMKDQIIIKDYDYYNLFNSVLKTKLPEEEFYKRISLLRTSSRPPMVGPRH